MKVLVLSVLLVGGCASLMPAKTKIPMQADTERVPSAEGVVEVTQTDEGNNKVKVKVEHLAHPQLIAPDATTYVVWARPNAQGGEPQNLGQLKVDNKLNGELSTVVPFPNFEVFITAEPSGTATEPSGDELLNANVSGTSVR